MLTFEDRPKKKTGQSDLFNLWPPQTKQVDVRSPGTTATESRALVLLHSSPSPFGNVHSDVRDSMTGQ